MKTVIHVNQHVIRRNRKTGERNPPLTVKTYKGNTKATRVLIGDSTIVTYEPDHPLKCGAVCWVETPERVLILD